jgi:membrane protease YdiL (CAAX protease family)
MNIKINKFSFIFCVIIITLLTTFLLSYTSSFFNVSPSHSEIINNYSALKFLILLVFVAPLLETLFLQAAIIEFFLYHLNVKNLIIPVFISGLIFGLLHFLNTFNFIYMLAAIIMGILFASIYTIAKRRGDINPLIITFVCHFTTNFLAFLLKYL